MGISENGKLVLCKSPFQPNFAMTHCNFNGICVEYKEEPIDSRQCLCFDEFTGEFCESFNSNTFIKQHRNINFIQRLNDSFKQEREVSDDRFLFIAVIMFSNTLIMLFGIFISYQKTKRWNYDRTHEPLNL